MSASLTKRGKPLSTRSKNMPDSGEDLFSMNHWTTSDSEGADGRDGTTFPPTGTLPSGDFSGDIAAMKDELAPIIPCRSYARETFK